MDTFAGMTLLTDITKVAPSSEALLRVYENQLTLNAAAKRLLRLDDDSQVAFRTSDSGPAGTKRLYVAKKSHSAYSVVKVGNGYRVRSAALCKSIAELLQGYGTYRIEGENPVRDYNGDVCYCVFFRRYE